MAEDTGHTSLPSPTDLASGREADLPAAGEQPDRPTDGGAAPSSGDSQSSTAPLAASPAGDAPLAEDLCVSEKKQGRESSASDDSAVGTQDPPLTGDPQKPQPDKSVRGTGSFGEDFEDRPEFRDLSRLAKVITIGCLVPVLISWAILAYSLYVGRENALERSFNETSAQAEVFREHAERNLDLANEFTTQIKNGFESGTRHSYKFLEYSRYRRVLPYDLYVTDANGDLVSGDYPGGNAAFSLAFAIHFTFHQAVDSNSLYISRSIWDEWQHRWIVSASRRLNDHDGSYAGIIVFTIDAAQFFDYYAQGDDLTDQRLFLIGRDLVVRASRTGSSDFINSLLHNQEVIDALKTGTNGSFIASAELDAEPYIYSYASLNRYPLIVVAGRTKASALAEANRRSVGYAGLALICMVSGFVLWWLLMKLVNRQYGTEQELRQVQAELQLTVQRRTAQLTAANATLTETNQSLANLNRDMGDEIDRRRMAEDARRQASEKLEYTAFHDAVTGLPNLTYILDWLQRDIEAKGAGVMALVRLDNLDKINDAFGYEAGYELTNTAARALTAAAGGLPGAIVAHLGYGRFVVIVPGVDDSRQVPQIAEIIEKSLTGISGLKSMLIHVTAATGFVLYPAHGTNPMELIQNADNALAAARDEQKLSWCLYEDRMKEVVREHMALTAQLWQAINNNEFLLLYQPKVSVATGKVASFEALIRWHSPVLGLVRPDLFIPLAEQNGLITPISQWVLKEASRFAKRLRTAGWGDVTIAVNVSGVQFSADNFLDSVMDTIAGIGIPNEAIEVEITETAVMTSLAQSIEKISILRSGGIRIALDDFGVRYSTLSYLLQLPFDTLKVDKSFVDHIGVTEHGTDIVRMIIEMAHLLGKEVVAEGVESREQYDILARLQCDLIQGYYFSKPLSETSAFDYLRREKRWSHD